MIYSLIKIVITSVLIVIISEVSKRSSLLGAVLTSLPLVSILAMIWLYIDTKDASKVIDLTHSILWFIIPSLAFFISLPLLLKKGVDFYVSMGIACTITGLGYVLMIMILTRFGIKL
jgi:uncharacterized membrane protein (GlpM family)